MALKIGDVVWLRSGGPPMTVTGVDPGDRGGALVRCEWLDGGAAKGADFLGEALTGDGAEARPMRKLSQIAAEMRATRRG